MTAHQITLRDDVLDNILAVCREHGVPVGCVVQASMRALQSLPDRDRAALIEYCETENGISNADIESILSGIS